MARNEFVKARVSQEEKEIYQQLCEQAGCTEAELIRSVLIHREISLDDLDDEMQVLDRKKKALHKQQEDYRRAQASRETDERGEPISEKRCIPFQVMLTAPEKKQLGNVRRLSAFLQANWFAAAQFTERSNHSILISRKLKNSITSY